MFKKFKQLFLADKAFSFKAVDMVYKPSDNFENFLYKFNTYFAKHPAEQKQYSKEINYLNHLSHITAEEKKLHSVMPYSFTDKYDYNKVEVFRDNEAEMFYVYLEGKKLYYHEGYTDKESVQKSFIYISAEQDLESPHRYIDDLFFVKNGDTVVDLGAAEGNFSLFVVDKAKELFIVEADTKWIPALQKTFQPWKHKVHIINKFAANTNSDTQITLTDLSKYANIDLVKMDIEGAEADVLQEASNYITQETKLRLAITTYHHQHDAEKIQKLISACGYQTVFSDKYILFIYDILQPPYFRKGMLKAINKKETNLE